MLMLSERLALAAKMSISAGGESLRVIREFRVGGGGIFDDWAYGPRDL
jgi:hypothetical protein